MTVTADTFTAAPGSTVHIRDEEWLVTKSERTTDGWFVDVIGLSGITRDTAATFSTALDRIEVVDPRQTQVAADDSPNFRRSRLWLEAMVRKTPVPIADPTITTADRSLADVLPYQRTAVTQALDPANLRPRILLADAVGLGKTIEIGMILAELTRRGRGERILVVTPKHVLEQMQFELWTRFALPFVRLDSAGIQRVRQKLPAGRNPFAHFKRVIISIDTLKSDAYVPHLRTQRWDAVVIDESHNVTNTSTLNNRLANLLARNTDALILASATPHNGRAESFAELIRMLEPSAVNPDNTLNEELTSRLIIRRHRHSPEVAQTVGSNWAERLPPENRLVAASPIENEIAEELENTWLWPEHGTAPTANSLFPWLLAKAYLSSPAALAETIKNRLSRIKTDGGAQAERERSALTDLAELSQRALNEPSAKYAALVDLLTTIGVGPKSAPRAVVFAERVPTLTWLRDKLMKDLKLKSDQVAVLHGGLSDVEQQAIVESFKLASSPIRVLVTGDVASEGVNLHAQCHHLIHYDIPWSLIRIEQRNGRIDRYGQQHSPAITTLLLNPSTERFAGDIRVLTKLVEREHEAHKALGDSASLMGTYDVKAEEDAILRVIRGDKALEDVVKSVEEVTKADGPTGVLARLLALGRATSSVPAPAVETAATPATTGLFATDHEFLVEALRERYETPGLPLARGGVNWEDKPNYAIASMAPPRDLAQRLEVLPQSYLRDRKVTENLTLATTPAKGKAELVQARSAESTSAWPEAHFLSPLHPILDWAADNALAKIGRTQVFAVRGDVDGVTVLLQGTLTNARGQVVASTYVTALFPFGPNGQPLLTVHPTAHDAVDSLRLLATNTGAVGDAPALQQYVRASVEAAEEQVKLQVAAIRTQTQDRVQAWQERATRWVLLAGSEVQRQSVRDQTKVISQENELAAAMLPDRTLVRPLLVVVEAATSLEGQS